MALDRDGVGARQPLLAARVQAREQPRDILGAVDALRRERRARADLDAQIGPRQAAEGILVGDVVPHEDRGRRPDLMADRVERVALVGVDDCQLDDLLALARMHAGQPRRALPHGSDDGGGVLLRGLPVVQRGACGLVLHEHAGPLGGDGVQVVGDPVAQRQRLRGQRPREADVELGAVAADQMDLLRQSRERREVVQRAARDHGHAGVAERGQRAQRRDRLAARARLARHVDDRRERAVVVARDEQVRLAREPRKCLLERLHVAVRVLRGHAAGSASASRNDRAKRCTSCVRT